MSARDVVVMILGLGFAAATTAFWWWTMNRGDARARAWVARRYRVEIESGRRGHWNVTSGPGSKLKHFLIELLQIGYLLAVFVVWGLGAGVMALLLVLLHDAL